MAYNRNRYNSNQGRGEVIGFCGIAIEMPIVNSDDEFRDQIVRIYERKCQKPSTSSNKLNVKNRLMRQFNEIAPGQIDVIIIGSSMISSLALNNSDLDLCLKPKLRKQFHMQPEEILQALRETIFEKNQVSEWPRIVGRKKPVMRFEIYTNSPMKVDLQIYNQHVMRSNNLIARYAAADRRFPILAVILKLWAKSNNIHDASQGNLSSYAIILLLVQYFQDGADPPIFLGANQSNQQVLTPHQNSQRIGNMLIGFFKYYSQQFDFYRMTVSVRAGYPVIRKHTSDLVSIEEPFILTNVAKPIKSQEVLERIKYCFKASYSSLSRYKDLDRIF